MKIKGFWDTISWYDQNAKKYADIISDYPSYEYLNEFKRLVKKGRVLDAGCAGGRDTNLLSKAKFEELV